MTRAGIVVHTLHNTSHFSNKASPLLMDVAKNLWEARCTLVTVQWSKPTSTNKVLNFNKFDKE